MRHAYFDQAVLRNSKGEFAGICFGYAYCAEHEWGIEPLRQDFGIPEVTREVLGADARTVTVVPKDLKFFRSGRSGYLVYHRSYRPAKTPRREAKAYSDRMEASPKQTFCTAWSGEDFGIIIINDKERLLETLFEALTTLDAMLYLRGRGNPFGGTGLMLCIRSRMDEGVLKQMADFDRDQLDLRDAFAATGIEARLKAANKRHFALSPRWTDETKSELIFWLNPRDRQNDNFGWFTLQDLEDWMAGSGKIPKAVSVP